METKRGEYTDAGMMLELAESRMSLAFSVPLAKSTRMSHKGTFIVLLGKRDVSPAPTMRVL